MERQARKINLNPVRSSDYYSYTLLGWGAEDTYITCITISYLPHSIWDNPNTIVIRCPSLPEPDCLCRKITH